MEAVKLEEKRRFPRIVSQTPLRYQILGSREFKNTTCSNLSSGGLSFVNDTYIAPNTPMAMEFNILSRQICPTGKICWVEPLPHSYRYRLGVEFSQIDFQQKACLNNYIDIQARPVK